MNATTLITDATTVGFINDVFASMRRELAVTRAERDEAQREIAIAHQRATDAGQAVICEQGMKHRARIAELEVELFAAREEIAQLQARPSGWRGAIT